MLALFALYLQILLPLGQAVAVSLDDSGLPTRLVICTSYGIRLVDIGSGEKAPDRSGDGETCPVCLAYSIGTTSLDNSVEISIDAPRLRVASLLPSAEAGFISQFLPGDRTARAPPASA